jgi:hypothetical protein
LQSLYIAGHKAILDEMKRSAITHGVVLEEKKTSVLTPSEEKLWLTKGIKPERYRKKNKKNV